MGFKKGCGGEGSLRDALHLAGRIQLISREVELGPGSLSTYFCEVPSTL